MVKCIISLALFSAISLGSCASFNMIDYGMFSNSQTSDHFNHLNSKSISDDIDSSIYSNHHIKVKKVSSSIDHDEVPLIVIDSNSVPIKMLFKTESASLDIKQEHKNAASSIQESNSIDGEVVLKHTIKKPIVQYVYEEIIPSRYLTQKIEPVKEFVKTIILKNQLSSNDAASQSSQNNDVNKRINRNIK